MDLSLLLKGILLGFSIAAPVGPIGIICIRQTISKGRLAGLSAGLGAASADAIYGAVAGFGITFISNFLISQQFLFRFFGGIFLCYLGIKTFVMKPSILKPGTLIDDNHNKGNSSTYLTTLLLTLTNPMTIISFATIFSGLGLVEPDANYSSALQLILGVLLGSTSWWVLLSTITGSIRQRFNIESMRWVNRISGLIISSFGFYALFSLIP